MFPRENDVHICVIIMHTTTVYFMDQDMWIRTRHLSTFEQLLFAVLTPNQALNKNVAG